MSEVTILRGISGAGKSKFAAVNHPTTYVVSADHFFQTAAGYRFDATKLSEAHALCLRHFVEAVRNNVNVVVDNTNTSVEEIAPYYAIAEAYGRDVEIVTLDISIEVAAERNVHAISIESVRHQASKLKTARLPSRWNHRVINQ